jgi:predicted DNA-binding protein
LGFFDLSLTKGKNNPIGHDESRATARASHVAESIEGYMSVNILIQFSEETAAALRAEKEKSGCPVSEFVRRAVEHSLHHPHADDYWKPRELTANERFKSGDEYLTPKVEQK